MPVAFSGGHNFIPTRSILVAVQAALQALTLTTPVTGSAFATGGVKIYGHEQITKAIQDLLTFDDRLAFIVPVRLHHTTSTNGYVQITKRRLEFVVLVSDRVYGDFDAAAQIGISGATPNPGAMNLAELVIEQLVGQILGFRYLSLEVLEGEPFQVENKGLARARDCWAQTFITNAGEVRVDMSRAAGTIPTKFAT